MQLRVPDLLGGAFDQSKANSKWYQRLEGHLLCGKYSDARSGKAACSACASPMCASRAAPMDSIRCRALEAVVMLMDGDDTEEETRDAACQTSDEDRCVEADQTRSCRTCAEDLASSAVT